MHNPLLSYLDEVARQGSIRKAAKLLNISSSAVNRQILKLEKELGVKVFDRIPDGVVLTDAGREIIEHSRKTLYEYRALLATVDDIREQKAGHIVISSLDSLTFDFLPNVLERFSRDYPKISYTLRTTSLDGALEEVANGEADVGIGFLRNFHPDARVVAEKQTPFGVIVPPNHPFADKTAISLKQCQPFPMVRTIDARGRSSILDEELETTDTTLNTVFYTNSLLMAKNAILSGLGLGIYTKIGFLPEINAKQLRFIPLAEPKLMEFKIGIFISAKKNLNTATHSLVNLMERNLRDINLT